MSDQNEESVQNFCRKQKEKENRWERIRNKHIHTLHITSNVVNKLYDLNYINDQQMKSLTGEDPYNQAFSNPVLVMNLRHGMIKRKPNFNTHSVRAMRSLQMENLRKHNETIESNLMDNELQKWKDYLLTLKPKVKVQNAQVHNFISHLPEVDDNAIFQSMDEFKKITSQFYDKINDVHFNNIDEGDKHDQKTSLINVSDEAASEEVSDTNKIVRFGDTIKVITYPKQHSQNTVSFSSSLGSDLLEVESLDSDSNYDDLESNILMYNRMNPNFSEDYNFNRQHEDDHYEIEEIYELNEHNCEGQVENHQNIQESKSLEIVPYEANNDIQENNINHTEYLRPLKSSQERNNYDFETEIDEYLRITRFDGGNTKESSDSSIDMESLPMDKDVYEEYLRIKAFDASPTPTSSLSPDSNESNSIIGITLSKYSLRSQSPLKSDDRDLMLIKKMELEDKNTEKSVIDDISPEKQLKLLNMEKVKKFDLKKRYFQKWFQICVVGRIKKGCQLKLDRRTDRFKRINELINKSKIERRPKEENELDSNKVKKPENLATKKNFEHKLKIQQDIIELQKMKLERQERMINELKLSKFAEASKQCKAEMKSELQLVAKSGDPKLRARARCIQITANIKPDHDEEDEARKLLAQGLLVPKFLSKMQQRAEERVQKHLEARERRLRLEKDKEQSKIAVEEEKRQQDEEAKKKRIEELKEKRRLEKIEKVQRELEKQRMVANIKKAKEFYLRKLVQNHGMKQFKILLRKRRMNVKKALNFRRKMCERTCYRAWLAYTRLVWERRKQKACNHYNLKIKRCSFLLWKEYYNLQQSKLMVAVDWFDVKISERIFKIWLGRTIQIKILELNKMKNAEAHYNWQMKFKIMDRWQRLPTILKIEKETEQRRQKWRMKIWELLPDYRPLNDD